MERHSIRPLLNPHSLVLQVCSRTPILREVSRFMRRLDAYIGNTRVRGVHGKLQLDG